jgi:hypothetical protein
VIQEVVMSLIGLLVLAAAPVATGPSASPATRPTGQCQIEAVPVARVRGDRDAGRAAWSVRRVTDVRLDSRLPPGTASAGIEFHVFTPSGHLYRRLATPVALESPGTSGGLKRTPKPTAGVVLPVAGTGIVRNGLYGQWTVVPHLADDQRPCGRSISFDLAP